MRRSSGHGQHRLRELPRPGSAHILARRPEKIVNPDLLPASPGYAQANQPSPPSAAVPRADWLLSHQEMGLHLRRNQQPVLQVANPCPTWPFPDLQAVKWPTASPTARRHRQLQVQRHYQGSHGIPCWTATTPQQARDYQLGRPSRAARLAFQSRSRTTASARVPRDHGSSPASQEQVAAGTTTSSHPQHHRSAHQTTYGATASSA